MRVKFTMPAFAVLALASSAQSAFAQNTTVADVNVLNLLSPFLSLNGTAAGQAALTANLNNAITINNYAATQPVIEGVSISDKTIMNGASTSITLAGGATANYGPGANLAGGLPAQAIQNGATPGTITPLQQFGGLGQLGNAYQAAVNPAGATTPSVVTLLANAYNFTSTDLGIAKFYFANGTTNGTTTAVAPTGTTLPTANGFPNRTTSVYDIAYGVSNTGANQNIFGDSRPVQVAPNSINGYDPNALQGLASNPSFPSGHTTYAFTDSILIGMMSPQYFQSMLLRGSEYGNSRIDLGVHYTLDIIASRSFVSYDLAQLLNATNPAYLQTNTPTGATAQNLNTQFQAAATALTANLNTAAAGTSCGTVANCAATNSYNTYSAATYANAPFVTNAGTTTASINSAIYQSRLTFGLPTLSFAAAPREAAPTSTGDASILLATVYGGSSTAAQGLAASVGGALYGNLSTNTINQIIVNTETNALAAFYGTALSYWARLDLYDAAGYFQNVTGTISLASTDQLNTNVTVANTGVLAGAGNITGNVMVNSGGTLAPTTTMNIAGNLAFQSGAFYMVQVSSTGTSSANITGTAALAGTVQVASPTGSFKFNQAYTILTTTAGLNGTTFNALALPTGVNGALSHTPNNVQVSLTSGLGQIAGLNANQRAVGSVLDRAFNAGGSTGPLAAIFTGNVAQNLSQASGETATGSQQTTFGAMTQFMNVMMDPFVDSRGAPVSTGGASQYADENAALAYASNGKSKNERDAYAAIYRKAPQHDPVYDPHWSVWAAGFGGSQTTDGNAAQGSSSTTSRIYGTAVGADYLLSPNTIAGFSLAGGGTNFSIANGGSGTSDLFQVGGFVRHTAGAAYVSGALAYGWQDITTNRTVTIAGLDQLQAKFNANAFSGRLEGGYRFVAPVIGGLGITPYAAGQFTVFDLPAYAEQALIGNNTFAQAFGAQSVTDSRSELGVRTDKSYIVQDGIFTLRGRAAWAHDYNPNRGVSATFQALPGASFVTNGAAQASDSALVTGTAEMRWRNGISFAATFEGEFSDVTRSYAGKGVVRYSW
jgi:subtilase-type serine protease